MVRIVDNVDRGVSGPPVIGVILLLLPLDEECFIVIAAETPPGESSDDGVKILFSGCCRSMMGLELELCGLPFRRGVFDLDTDDDAPLLPPPLVSRDSTGLRLEFRPRC